MKTILIIYGRPISVNHLYQTGKSRTSRRTRFLTDDGKRWKDGVAVSYLQMFGQLTHKGNITVFVEYYFPDHRRRDVTNYDKAILDALQLVAYNDDNQITKFIAVKSIDSKNPRTVVTIYSDFINKSGLENGSLMMDVIDKFVEVLEIGNYTGKLSG